MNQLTSSQLQVGVGYVTQIINPYSSYTSLMCKMLPPTTVSKTTVDQTGENITLPSLSLGEYSIRKVATPGTYDNLTIKLPSSGRYIYQCYVNTWPDVTSSNSVNIDENYEYASGGSTIYDSTKNSGLYYYVAVIWYCRIA